MISSNVIVASFLGLIAFSCAFDPTCKGNATFKVEFRNLLTPGNFGSLIPEDGLVFAPIAGVSHSNRQSFLTVRGFASRAVETIAETGDTSLLIRRAQTLRDRGEGVKSVTNTSGLILPGDSESVTLQVDCEHPFVTVLCMLAPSPDWIVQISNMNLYDSKKRSFVKFLSGHLIAYDAGTDDGGDFTDPDDLTLDIPTDPPKNIAPLVEDETDRFEGRFVGKYSIYRIF